MAMNTPASDSSLVLPSMVLFRRTPVTPLASPSTSSRVVFQCRRTLPFSALSNSLSWRIFLRTQLVATVDQVDFLGDVGQVQRFLDGGIAAADHLNHLVAVEEAVAGGAGGNALPMKASSDDYAQVLRGGTGGNDQCIAGISATIALQCEGALLQLGGVDVVVDDLGVETLGVLLHAGHQRRAGKAFDVARPVVDFGGGGQLAAWLDAGDHHWLEIGACGVHGGGIAGRTGAQDDEARMLDFTHKKDSISLCHA